MKHFLAFAFSLFLAGLSSAVEPRTVLFFGDSLTAGHGLEDVTTEAFPGIIQGNITAAGLPYRVVNAGLSGETTAGGLRRIDWILRMPVAVFVLELGGNDGLRGLPIGSSAKNLQGIIDKVRAKNPSVKVVVAGMKMPSNMGAYATEFASMYPSLARNNDAALIPFLLEGVGGHPLLNQPDGIHPTAEGHKRIAETAWKALRPLLEPVTR